MMVSGRRIRGLAVAALLGLVAACGSSDASAGDTAAPENRMMGEGLRALYDAQDPVAADSLFRRVLAINPTHYGARYQLAVALDRSGKPGDARSEWNEVLRQAQSYSDSATIQTARARLAMPDTASQGGLMVQGLHLMYKQGDATGAEQQFRAILAKNPTHYGATYQLATALDRQGKRRDATPLWQRVAGMAASYRDSATLRTARARLATP